jgi:hypothetical protein
MRKTTCIFAIISILFFSCDTGTNPETQTVPVNQLIGTWIWAEGDSSQELIFTETEYTFKGIYSDSPIELEEFSGEYIFNNSIVVFHNFTYNDTAMDYFINRDKLFLYNRERNMLWDFTKQ